MKDGVGKMKKKNVKLKVETMKSDAGEQLGVVIRKLQ